MSKRENPNPHHKGREDNGWEIDWLAAPDVIARWRAQFEAREIPAVTEENGAAPFFLVVVGVGYRVLGYRVTPDDYRLFQMAQAGEADAALEVRRRQLEVLARIGVPLQPGLSFAEAWVITVATHNHEPYNGSLPARLERALKTHAPLREFYMWLRESGNRFDE